jgi:hypothetical protein
MFHIIREYTISKPLDMRCGSRCGRTPTSNGYICVTASWRGAYKWPLRIGKTNGGFHSSLETYPQKERRRRQDMNIHMLSS